MVEEVCFENTKTPAQRLEMVLAFAALAKRIVPSIEESWTNPKRTVGIQ